MKKTISLAVILLLAMCSASYAEKAAPDTPVFTTNSFGDRNYHLDFCPKTKRGFGKNKVTLQTALDKGLKPHKKCKPPSELTYRIQPPKPKITKTSSRNVTIGDSAADIERDPDGTAIGKGGGFSITASDKPKPISDRPIAAHEELQGYDILDIKTKLTDRSSGYDTVSLLITVRNLLNERSRVSLSLQGIDREGFEIVNKFVACSLSANAVEICTGQTMYKSKIGKKIKSWQPK